MQTLAIDIETYSETSITFGVNKYAEDPAFEILIIAYKFDNENVKIIDLALGEEMPSEFINALSDKNILKTAYNAAFEITCFNKHFCTNFDFSQWSCTMVLAAQAGLPFGLDAVSKALDTNVKKDSKGKDLIKYFSIPCKPTAGNGMRTRNMPADNFSDWLDYKAYCTQDVITEQSVRDCLAWFKVAEFEQNIWALDQKINNAGVRIDITLVKNAIAMDAIISSKLNAKMAELTDIINPKSNAQVKKFIESKTGVVIASLNKSAMPEVLKDFKDNSGILDILQIRERLSRTSIKKFAAMDNSVGNDGKIRGLFQYYGASRTGRWAGRNVQLQNLKRNNLSDLDFARTLVLENNLQALELCYDDVGDVLSNLIRTAFIPDPGNLLIVSDFSAIEARIIAWFSGEKWRLEVFATHGKIYEASAAMMFKIPIEEVTKELRMKGKIAELALGYQGALGALQRMGGESMGLSEPEMTAIVQKWRFANKRIVQFWYDVQECFIECITNGHSSMKYLSFKKINTNITVRLPSGRELVYVGVKFDFGSKITYRGMNQLTKQWDIQDTYGGKLVENIVQATARDVLAQALVNVDKAGHNIIMHVHDEIVVDSAQDVSAEITSILSQNIDWAPGLILKAETFTAKYYQK